MMICASWPTVTLISSYRFDRPGSDLVAGASGSGNDSQLKGRPHVSGVARQYEKYAHIAPPTNPPAASWTRSFEMKKSCWLT